MSNAILNLKTDQEFEQEISTTQGLILLDFYADWCNPCKSQTPILEDIAMKLSDKIKIIKINIEELATLSANFQIKSIPTLVLLKDSKEVDRKIGLQDNQNLTEWINSY